MAGMYYTFGSYTVDTGVDLDCEDLIRLGYYRRQRDNQFKLRNSVILTTILKQIIIPYSTFLLLY